MGFGAVKVTTPYETIGFGAMAATRLCEFIGFGAMDATKPPMNLRVLGPCVACSLITEFVTPTSSTLTSGLLLDLPRCAKH